jgi:hypothetical protein
MVAYNSGFDFDVEGAEQVWPTMLPLSTATRDAVTAPSVRNWSTSCASASPWNAVRFNSLRAS